MRIILVWMIFPGKCGSCLGQGRQRGAAVQPGVPTMLWGAAPLPPSPPGSCSTRTTPACATPCTAATRGFFWLATVLTGGSVLKAGDIPQRWLSSQPLSCPLQVSGRSQVPRR